jgi:hypothetical protein
MATQLRLVDSAPVTTHEIITGLAQLRTDLKGDLREAEEISFAFTAARGLVVEMKTGRRELREALLHKLNSDALPYVRFDKIVEGVEKGARRRLTITAEVV